jgi:hypothetical protein
LIPAAYDVCGDDLEGIVTGSHQCVSLDSKLGQGIETREQSVLSSTHRKQHTRKGMKNEEKEEKMGESRAYDPGENQS